MVEKSVMISTDEKELKVVADMDWECDSCGEMMKVKIDFYPDRDFDELDIDPPYLCDNCYRKIIESIP